MFVHRVVAVESSQSSRRVIAVIIEIPYVPACCSIESSKSNRRSRVVESLQSVLTFSTISACRSSRHARQSVESSLQQSGIRSRRSLSRSQNPSRSIQITAGRCSSEQCLLPGCCSSLSLCVCCLLSIVSITILNGNV